MKKVLFTAALVMGLGGSAAFAGNMMSNVESMVMVNEYKSLEVEGLPQAVQDAIKKEFVDQKVETAAVELEEDGTKQARRRNKKCPGRAFCCVGRALHVPVSSV